MANRVARLETPLGRILREEGRTQTWLAGRLGVKRQQVWMWVHGIHVPAQETRTAIAAALGRQVDELWPEELAEAA